MQLDSRDDGATRIVAVREPRIDAAVAIRFKDLMRAESGDAPPRVILDLGAVEFIDSSGLGAIVAAMKQMEDRRLELAAVTPAVDKVFRLTRIDRIFTIHPSVEAALAAPAG